MRTPDPSAPDAPLPRFWSSARRFPRACAVVAAVCAGAFCGIPLGFVGALTGLHRFGASVPLEAAHLPSRLVVAAPAGLRATRRDSRPGRSRSDAVPWTTGSRWLSVFVWWVRNPRRR